MTIADFSITWPLIGGALIGLSAALLLLLCGRVAGISGIVFSILEGVVKLKVSASEHLWRVCFIVGIVLGAFLFHFVFGAPIPKLGEVPYPIIIAGGLLVGIGTKIGSGCTSGHGVCGIARFSLRSIASTVTFMFFGVVSLVIFRHFLGWI